MADGCTKSVLMWIFGSGWQGLTWYPLLWILPRTDHASSQMKDNRAVRKHRAWTLLFSEFSVHWNYSKYHLWWLDGWQNRSLSFHESSCCTCVCMKDSGSFQDWNGDASGVDDEFRIRCIVEISSWIWDLWKTFLVGKWKTQSHISCMFSNWCLGWVVEVNERLEGVVIWGRKTFWVGRSSSGWDLKVREKIKTYLKQQSINTKFLVWIELQLQIY